MHPIIHELICEYTVWPIAVKIALFSRTWRTIFYKQYSLSSEVERHKNGKIKQRKISITSLKGKDRTTYHLRQIYAKNAKLRQQVFYSFRSNNTYKPTIHPPSIINTVDGQLVIKITNKNGQNYVIETSNLRHEFVFHNKISDHILQKKYKSSGEIIEIIHGYNCTHEFNCLVNRIKKFFLNPHLI